MADSSPAQPFLPRVALVRHLTPTLPCPNQAAEHKVWGTETPSLKKARWAGPEVRLPLCPRMAHAADICSPPVAHAWLLAARASDRWRHKPHVAIGRARAPGRTFEPRVATTPRPRVATTPIAHAWPHIANLIGRFLRCTALRGCPAGAFRGAGSSSILTRLTRSQASQASPVGCTTSAWPPSSRTHSRTKSTRTTRLASSGASSRSGAGAPT